MSFFEGKLFVLLDLDLPVCELRVSLLWDVHGLLLPLSHLHAAQQLQHQHQPGRGHLDEQSPVYWIIVWVTVCSVSDGCCG